MGKKKTEKTETLVTFVLDRSGSMGSVRDATIEAFNDYVGGLAEEDSILFNLVQFDSLSIDRVHHEVRIKDVPMLTAETYVPRATTPLIDASYETIRAVERSVEKKPKGTKVIVCIQTDGHENASREHSWSDLKKLIAEKQTAGWQFNFLGAGIDAYQQASQMGISDTATMSYRNDAEGAKAAFSASALNSVNYARGISMSTEYSVSQRGLAGDAHWGDRTVEKKEKSGGKVTL